MIDYLEIQRFKSIKEVAMTLSPINIIIGGNGAGKSNFISFFKLLTSIFNLDLQSYIIEENADSLLYYGRKNSQELSGKLIFTDDGHYNNAYKFVLEATNDGGMYISREGSGYQVSVDNDSHNYFYNHGLLESKFAADTKFERNRILKGYISSLRVFHFHDTSVTSPLRKPCDVDDNHYLKADGRNLPAYLYLLKEDHPTIYNRILKTIQTVAPYIKDFILTPRKLRSKSDEITLRWIDKGDSESNFSVFQLSDGTLRFIALTTLLLQPNPPAVIIIDEPELGLHPFAISRLAGMIRTASNKCQIIAATQSPGLISHFDPEDIIVIDRDENENQSTFSRLNSDILSQWLQDFTLGDLWERNIIKSGQPFFK